MATDERLSYLHAPDHDFRVQMALAHNLNPCKNLTLEFQAEDIDNIDTEYLRVYLRIRPVLATETEPEEPIIEIDKQSITLNPPSTSNTFKNNTNGITKFCQKFSFSQVYDPTTTQKELFDETTLVLVNSFLDGENCLLFTYGATSSGKTYTVQGTPNDAGILPRTFDIIFSTVGKRHYPHSDLRPKYFCNVFQMDKKEIQKEQEIKDAIFNMSHEHNSTHNTFNLSANTSKTSINCSDVSTITIDTNSDSVLQLEDSLNTSDGDAVFALFVSYIEIYNENIYDLLDRGPFNKRKGLNLGEDRNASIYVKGLTEVRVNNANEAMKLMEIGRQNLHFAATKLNHNSSRSHCIFTIKLIRLADAQSPNFAKVSMLSICDLAGAERSKKTQGCQERVKEAGNINNSLLALGRCIAALRQNQVRKNESCINKRREIPVPYRDSKLTRLFQSFFLGRGRAAMIVNISKSPYLFDETLQVLKFSAIAKQVTISQIKQQETEVIQPRRPSGFNKLRQSLNNSRSSGRLSVPWENDSNMTDLTFGGDSNANCKLMSTINEDAIDEEEEESDEYYELRNCIAKLREELCRVYTEKKEIESRVRKELRSEYSNQLVKIENTFKQRYYDIIEKTEDLHEHQINVLMKSIKKQNQRKRMRQDDQDPDEEYVPSLLLFQEERKVEELNEKVKELEEDNKFLQEQVDMVKDSLNKTTKVSNKYKEENSKITFQLANLTSSYDQAQALLEKAKQEIECLTTSSKETINDEHLKKIRLLEDDLAMKNEKVEDLNDMLMEAAEEHLLKQNECTSLLNACKKQELHIVQLLENNTELESHIAQVQEVSNQRMQEIEELEEKINKLNQNKSNVNVGNEDVLCLKAEMEKKNIYISELEAEISQHKKTITNTAEDNMREKSKLLLQVASLRTTCPQQSKDMDTIQDDLKMIQSENEDLQEQIRLLNNQLAQSKNLLDNKTDEHHNEDELLKENEFIKAQLKQLNEENEQLNEKIIELQSNRADELLDFSSAQNDIFDASKEIEALKKELSQVKLTNTDLEKKLHEREVQEEEINNLKKQAKEANAEKDLLKSANEDLTDLLNNTSRDSEVKKLEARIQELEENIATDKHSDTYEFNILAEKTEIEENLERLQKEYDATVEKLNSQLAMKDNEISQLSKTIEGNEIDLKESTFFKNINKELRENIEELEAKLKSVNSQTEEKLTNYEKQIKELTEKLDQKVSEDAQIDCKYSEYEETIELLKKDLANLKNQHNSQLDRYESLEANHETLKEDCNNMRNKLDSQNVTHQNDLESYEQKLKQEKTNHQEELDKMKSSVEKLKEDISLMTSEKKTLEESIEQLNHGLKSLQKELEEKESKHNEEFKCQIEEKDKTIKKLQDTKNWLQDKICEVEQQNAKLKSEDSEKLAEQFANLQLQNENLTKNLKQSESLMDKNLSEKEDIINSLNAKIKSLDYKLSLTDDEYAKKNQLIQMLEKKINTLESGVTKQITLEKEIAALREARQEEQNLIQSQLDEKDELLHQKDLEINNLQQEIKKQLQESILKDSTEDQSANDSSVKTLRLELRKSEEIKSQLRQQLNEALMMKDQLQQSIANSAVDLRVSDITSNSINDQTTNCSLSESVNTTTSTGRGRKSRKNTSKTPINDADKDSFVTPAKGRRGRAKAKVEESPQLGILKASNSATRKSTRQSKMPVHFKDYNGSESRSTSRRRTKHSSEESAEEELEMEENSDDDDFVVMEKPEKKKNTRRTTKTKVKIENPHAPDKENKESKTPARGGRKQQLYSQSDEPFLGSPCTVPDPSISDDSPHTVVRRQLRRLKK